MTTREMTRDERILGRAGEAPRPLVHQVVTICPPRPAGGEAAALTIEVIAFADAGDAGLEAARPEDFAELLGQAGWMSLAHNDLTAYVRLIGG